MQRDHVSQDDKSDNQNRRAEDDDAGRSLDQNTWLEFQVHVAKEAVELLEENAKKLKKGDGKREKRVHNMRIALRRWYTIWSVLLQEGFESEAFNDKLGRKIKKAYKLLGIVRDWDVTLSLGKKFGVSPGLLARWKMERDRIEVESKAGLKRLDLRDLIKQLKKYVAKRSDKLSRKSPHKPGHGDSARTAIEAYLMRQEMRTQELAATARSLEDLHALRLSIKAWRYMLVEFYGFTSEALVSAQQMLGLINDLERLRTLIEADGGPFAAQLVEDVVEKQNEQIDQLDSMRESLPFGFRPERVVETDRN